MVEMIGMMRLIIRDSTGKTDDSDFADYWILLIAKYTCTKRNLRLANSIDKNKIRFSRSANGE